jgi:hypothetical protein
VRERRRALLRCNWLDLWPRGSTGRVAGGSNLSRQPFCAVSWSLRRSRFPLLRTKPDSIAIDELDACLLQGSLHLPGRQGHDAISFCNRAVSCPGRRPDGSREHATSLLRRHHKGLKELRAHHCLTPLWAGGRLPAFETCGDCFGLEPGDSPGREHWFRCDPCAGRKNSQ